MTLFLATCLTASSFARLISCPRFWCALPHGLLAHPCTAPLRAIIRGSHGHAHVFAPGDCIGPYEVESFIAQGGMGEVYRARDTRLKRNVALKVLPQSVASDADRLARFEREAQTLAALNHQHIAAIHGIEESNGTRALVMELVDGETLADRIARGPLPLDEVLPVARQIAEAWRPRMAWVSFESTLTCSDADFKIQGHRAFNRSEVRARNELEELSDDGWARCWF